MTNILHTFSLRVCERARNTLSETQIVAQSFGKKEKKRNKKSTTLIIFADFLWKLLCYKIQVLQK